MPMILPIKEFKNTNNVIIYSRNTMESDIKAGRFLQNSVVICFYEPDGTHIEYSDIAEDVIYIPLDDFQNYLPHADMIADFVQKSMYNNQNIICQCEKEQNRSAGCAAAILDHYYKTGNSIFDDEDYMPDDMVYYAVLDALERR